MARATRTVAGGNRLGSEDWLRAGLEVIAEDGIAGIKLQRLCDRLGVTKGSFYWHFEDLDEFLGALAAYYAQAVARFPRASDGEPEPGADLRHAMRSFSDSRYRNLARAMRDWAQHDERARAAIRRADLALFERVKADIASLGFDDAEAEVRAKILCYTGIGFAHVGPLGKRSSAKEQLRVTWEILTRRP